MKNLAILLNMFLFISCHKEDTINHFLTKPVTQEELELNGFYKYSYEIIIDDKDKVDDTIRSVIKYDMYSNVKPKKKKKMEIFIQLNYGNFIVKIL